ncbi:MAG: hypothetical protein ACP5UV_00675 [Thermoplasmata archaeon]
MIFIASIGKEHEKVKGYDCKGLVKYVSSFNPSKIYVTYVTHKDVETGNFGEEIRLMLNDTMIGEKLSFRGVDRGKYDKIYNDYINENSKSPEFVIKRNVIDLINTTVNSYLQSYWKSPETVNSEVTDSLFRAKHKLLISLIPEIEFNTWEKMHREILDNIEMSELTPNSVILSDVESRYWFIDHIED